MTQDDVAEYQKSFPGLNVQQVLRNIRQWSIDNPAKKKTARGIRKVISAWMIRDVDRGMNLLQGNGPRPTETTIAVTCFECNRTVNIPERNKYQALCALCKKPFFRRLADGSWTERYPEPRTGLAVDLVSKLAGKLTMPGKNP